MKSKKCGKGLSFEDCEMAILKTHVAEIEHYVNKTLVTSKEIKDIMSILETFLRQKKLVCYGGIAINAMLPDEAKIYNSEVDLPDYDFFSANAMHDAKELADIYHKKGYSKVEAKAGVHHGTYKVFVDFQGIADITYLPQELFNSVKKRAIAVDGILYTDPTYLKMSMYLELSRPKGDPSRWEKVFKRLNIINKYYPGDNDNSCQALHNTTHSSNNSGMIYSIIKNSFISQDVVFLGDYAVSQYSKYMTSKNNRKHYEKIADFDVLSENPLKTAETVKTALTRAKIKNVKIIKRAPIGEIIPPSYELKIDNDTIAFVYEPISCHNYNELKINNQSVKIATTDTIMSFYLAFLYADKPYYDTNRLLCITKIMFKLQQQHRLIDDGIFERFTMKCYGKSLTLQNIKEEKSEKIIELKDKRGTEEYDEWFLNYTPGKEVKLNPVVANKSLVKSAKKKSVTKKSATKTRRNSMGTRRRRKKYWEI
jgi:hypothetical protein